MYHAGEPLNEISKEFVEVSMDRDRFRNFQ
jgi:hypothetical protein